MKVVCQADRQQVMSDAVSVRKKRRRSDSTAGEEKPTVDEPKDADRESAEGDSGEDSDADPWHKLLEKKQSEKSVQPVWQNHI